MKTNLPITQTERFLEPGKPIVTKTDLKGRITYANESFINISGFTAEELVGASHNVVRHPDMPPAAFGDLWDTVKAGEPWRGLVKNRAKNGDFYWVEAFVTPITENGQPVGYMSVRGIPDKAEVQRAEQLYKDVREGRASLPTTPRLKPVARISKYVCLECHPAADADRLGAAERPGGLGHARRQLCRPARHRLVAAEIPDPALAGSATCTHRC